MIDVKFGLFWSGTEMSYLRYLTFVSLRKFHPNAEIELYISDNYDNSGIKWSCEKQDFQNNEFAQTVQLDAIEKLGVDIKRIDIFKGYPSNFQSDFFRWWWLKQNRGFYLDVDQIVLRSFDGLDLNYDFIYSEYQAPSCGLYAPVGVVGGSKNSEIVSWINEILPQYYDKNDYNSLGPWMFSSVLHTRKWNDRMHNTGSKLFYPAKDSCLVPALYCNMKETETLAKNIDDAHCLHWFGGHKASQAFNCAYTKEKAENALDLISCTLRNRGIL